MQNSVDLERNIALHLGAARRFGPEEGDLRVLDPSPVPSAPMRAAQRLAMKLGRLEWERAWLAKLLALRRSVCGEGASRPAALPRKG